MNNNSNSNRGNNRRRGRGNRQQGGGNQNRIDSRARGNAPQMLDKYKKLAQDAAHNGDRVQAEYYLQFADHYFRVIADSRPRNDEQRPRRDEQDFSNDDDGDEDDFAAPRQSRDDRQRDDRPREERQDRQRDDRQRDDRPRGERNRGDRQRQPREQNGGDFAPREEGERAQENGGATEYEPADNPFVRPSRGRRDGRGARQRSDETAEMTGNEGEIDASALPPSFSAPVANAEDEQPERATRKLPPRRRRKPADDAGEADDSLSAVG